MAKKNWEELDWSKGGALDCSKLKSGVHRYLLTAPGGTKWNLEIKKNCDTAFVDCWLYGKGSRYDKSAQTQSAALGKDALLGWGTLCELNNIQAAMNLLLQYQMATHVGLRNF